MKKLFKSYSMKGKEPSYTNLSIMLTIFLSIFGFLLALFNHLQGQINNINTLQEKLLSIFLIGVMGILGFYIACILLFLCLKIIFHGRSLKSGFFFEIKKNLLGIICYGLFSFVGINFILLFVYFLMVFNFLIIPSPLNIFTFFAITIFFLFCSFWGKWVFKQGLKRKITFAIVTIVILIFSLHIIINSFFYFTSGFKLEPDKEQYFIGDDAHIRIYPYGLSDISIKEIYYFNILLENRTEYKFKTPSYVTINSSNLSFFPPNSYISITYTYGKGFLFIPSPPKTVKSYFIPAFGVNSSDNKNSLTNERILDSIEETQKILTQIRNEINCSGK